MEPSDSLINFAIFLIHEQERSSAKALPLGSELSRFEFYPGEWLIWFEDGRGVRHERVGPTFWNVDEGIDREREAEYGWKPLPSDAVCVAREELQEPSYTAYFGAPDGIEHALSFEPSEGVRTYWPGTRQVARAKEAIRVKFRQGAY